jgi:hypothetical protein
MPHRYKDMFMCQARTAAVADYDPQAPANRPICVPIRDKRQLRVNTPAARVFAREARLAVAGRLRVSRNGHRFDVIAMPLGRLGVREATPLMLRQGEVELHIEAVGSR